MEKIRSVFSALVNKKYSGIFRQIPLSVPGKLFVSPMPTGAYDPGKLLKLYGMNHIDHIFPLVTDDEIKKKARRDIFREYQKLGISYTRYVIEDYQVPSLDNLKNLVDEAVTLLATQHKLLVHCHAGVGRTALAVLCIVMKVEHVGINEALLHIKNNMMVNVTSEQTILAEKYYKQYLNAENDL